MNEIFPLVDCNNFFASCERCFNPKLENIPLLILSNNDGCVIARSEEAKAYSIPMGIPAFKLKSTFAIPDLKMLSSNFSLYGDMSNRVVQILSKYASQIEVYSIDEAFLRLENMKINDFEEYGRLIVEDVKKSLGLPISIGIATSKTLAKIANRKAKKSYGESKGVSILMNEDEITNYLKILKIEDVWGIGHRTTRFLNSKGIYTALEFRNCSQQWIRDQLGVNGSRKRLELFGECCIELEDIPQRKKGILSSRSFGYRLTKKEQLEETVSAYISKASETLRKEGSLANMVTISINTDFHNTDLPNYYNSYTVTLKSASNYTPDLIKAGLLALDLIFKSGYEYKKSSVYLSGLVPIESYQYCLLDEDENKEKKYRLMKSFDKVCKKFGRSALFYPSQGISQPWRSRQENVSPSYTRSWGELLRVG